MPCLLLQDGGLVKTVKFKKPRYVGDPINAVRIYNEMEVDELIFLDITATLESREPPFQLISQLASECFMPFTYGGGIKRIEDINKIFSLGVEKIAINTYAVEAPGFIEEAANLFGSQSIVVSLDVKKKFFGNYEVRIHGGRKPTDFHPVHLAKRMEDIGAGEILLTSIDRDGTMKGYDIDIIRAVSKGVDIPVIACGGAGKVDDFFRAVRLGGASAVAAGSMAVYQGTNRAVLINFPNEKELHALFDSTT